MSLTEDVQRLSAKCKTIERELDEEKVEHGKTKERLALLEDRVSGERGLVAAIKELAGQVASLRTQTSRAVWGLAVIILAAAIGFAFGVPELTGQ